MLQGLPVSPGIAVGRAVIVRFAGLRAFRRAVSPDELAEEEARLRRASRLAAEEFRRHSGEAAGGLGEELSAILEAHGMIASDETFIEAIVERAKKDRVNVEWALAEVTRELGDRFAAADSDAMRERAEDIHDVAREIARQRGGGVEVPTLDLPPGSFLVADELSPVEASRLDPRRVRALALERGGPTSHATIIARSFGLPAVVGIQGLCAAVSPDRPIVVDGDRGTVDPQPSKERLRRSLVRVREGREKARRMRARTGKPAATRDGVRIVVRANLELVEEIPALEKHHAEGVGLFRSEFLFLKSAPEPPGIEAQREVYEALLEGAAPHPVVVRTYDLGGEKGIGPGGGDNPALGLRGIRYCLAHPEILDAQLTALCLASRKGPLSILLPMVASLGELRAVRSALLRAVKLAGISEPPPLGIMVEIPSAALLCERFVPESDFFSVGTNDLAQYGLAVDRANPDVAGLYQPLHPAILRMLRSVVDAGRSGGRPVAVCGELASDPIGIAVLVGLGIRELSVTPVAIAGVKDSLSAVDSVRARALAEKALDAGDAAEVEKMFRGRA